MNSRWFSFICWCLLVPAVQAASTNRYVSLNGGNASPYDSWNKAGTSIVAVVNYANTFNEGDMVWVSNGVYVLTAQVSVVNTTIKSFNTNLAGTIVNGNGAYSCFYLNHANAWLEGITISNGYLASAPGAGVYLNNGTVTNCTVRNCLSGSVGGGFVIYTGLVANCTIAGNVGGQGGGVAVNGNRAVVSNCTIIGNTAPGGGGIYLPWGASTTSLFYNCDICYNVATFTGYYSGGGIIGSATASGGTIFENCRIYGNTAGSFGGGSFGGQLLKNCIISNNVAGTSGGGVGSSYYLTGPIVNCTIVNNIASNQGGGIYLYGYQAVVSNCTIRGNTGGDGGGAYLYYPYTAGGRYDFYNCLFVNNVATNSGGGMVLDFSGTYNPMTFQNCTVVSNRALGASGIGGIRGMSLAATATFVNFIAYLNAGASASNWASAGTKFSFSNSCVAPTGGTYYIGANTIAADPLFLSPASGNYRLAKGSPCIDAGLNQDWMYGAVDLFGRVRIVNGTVDMGAYEWFPMNTLFTFH